MIAPAKPVKKAKCDHARGPRNERGLCPTCNYPLTFPAPMKKKPAKPRRVVSDIEVLGSGWWCPVMRSTFPQQCSHSLHHPSESVRCVVVTERTP